MNSKQPTKQTKTAGSFGSRFNSYYNKKILPKILSFIGTFEINTDPNTLSSYVDDLHLFNNYHFYVYNDRLKGKYKGLDIIIEGICLEKANT